MTRYNLSTMTNRNLGVFGIPICSDYKLAASNIAAQNYTDGAPCGDESYIYGVSGSRALSSGCYFYNGTNDEATSTASTLPTGLARCTGGGCGTPCGANGCANIVQGHIYTQSGVTCPAPGPTCTGGSCGTPCGSNGC